MALSLSVSTVNIVQRSPMRSLSSILFISPLCHNDLLASMLHSYFSCTWSLKLHKKQGRVYYLIIFRRKLKLKEEVTHPASLGIKLGLKHRI